MKVILPKVFCIASTALNYSGLEAYLGEIGAQQWFNAHCGGKGQNDGEILAEVAGRSCYKSFDLALNKNLSRIRDDSEEYLQNVVASKHGSVFEHVSATFAMTDVSRLLTHELVRHRAGTAFSQESGRFVRIDEVRFYMPDAFEQAYLERVYQTLNPGLVDTDEQMEFVQSIQMEFHDAMKSCESNVLRLQKMLKMDELPNFGMKKKLQSAVRRAAPEGRGNLIVITGNLRAWRHIIANRTAFGAEEEIRYATYKVFEVLAAMYPAIFKDAEILWNYDESTLAPRVTFAHDKI